MLKRKFNEALQDFAESVIGMSFDADQPEELGFLTHQEQRDRCAKKFAVVKEVWLGAPDLLVRLEALTTSSISAYAAGEFEQGHKFVMGIDEILWTFRA